MPRLTSRDYKGSRRSSLDLRRHREFLYGAGVGVLLASVVFMYVGARQHPGQPGSSAPPARTGVLAAADSSAQGGNSAELFTYPDMLAKSAVVTPAKEKRGKREPPAGQRAQGATR